MMFRYRHLVLLCSLMLSSALMAKEDKALALFDLTIQIEQVREAKGLLRIALYHSEDDWMELEKAERTLSLDAKKGVMQIAFKGLKKGEYGFAIYHDENANDKLDMQWLPPKPIEGVGTSNNATGVIGPPGWDDSRFLLDKSLKQSIKLVYM